jgi:MioC protein
MRHVHNNAFSPQCEDAGTEMALDLTILVGTMTGTAQLVAQELELILDGEDVRARTLLMDELDAAVFAGGGLFLICTSTYGQGDVPDNAKKLYASLQNARPDLSRVQYGVIALGDRTYAETLCNGGRRFDQVLSELGARRIGDILLHDASAGTLPEEVAAGWIGPWIEQCRAQSFDLPQRTPEKTNVH